MKTTIYYFSATGNSLKIAREVASGFDESELIPIPQIITKDPIVPQAERVGIIYPVYCFGMPLMVVAFIEKLRLSREQYIFAIATCGGMAGDSLKQTAQAIAKQGGQLAAGFIIEMPGNYTPLYGAISQEKQQKLFLSAQNRLYQVIAIVKAGQKQPIKSCGFPLNILFSGVLYRLLAPRLKASDNSFWVNNKCDGCEICMRICPANNILMHNGRPSWQHCCEQCMGCLQWCPQEAIQYGKRTSSRKRYRHPEARLSDFFKNP